MMEKDYIDKLDEIIQLLTNSDKNKLVKASYWKMGTSIFNMLDNLAENIEGLDISSTIICKENIHKKTVEGKNETYHLVIDENNVTPSKVKKYVGLSTITQYRRTFCAFGIGIEEEEYKTEKDFVINSGKIKLVYNAKLLLSKDYRKYLIIKLISDSIFSYFSYSRNFAYSIIHEYLFYKNFDFSLLRNNNNKIFYFNKMIGKRNEKKVKCLNLITDLNEIKNDIRRQGTIATYKEVINLISSEYESIEEFIDEIWESYKNKENDSIELINKNIEKNNLIWKIKNERTKFKSNIFENRKSLNLINNKEELYSDVENINGDQDGLLAKFNEAEAAHIYDVYKIKSDIFSKDNNEDNINKLLEYISNPHNGIVMRAEYHKAFDRGQWTFDSNGNMIVQKENQKYLFEDLKLEKIKIRKEVLDSEMKSFLEKR
ncbi:MAG: HNH endonuclease [Mycoplasma sp.]|nr:HNH endonuclease [Mycoplasma sp.]